MPHDFAPNAALDITPTFLADVVAKVRELGMEIVDPHEARRRLGEPASGRFCVFAFAGGYKDVLTHAWPVLKEHGAPFTVYIPTSFPDRTGDVWWLALEEILARQESIAVSRGGATELFPTRTLRAKQTAFDAVAEWLSEIGVEQRRAAVRELTWRYGVDGDALLAAETMDWSDIKELAADPLVTIGAETVNLPNLALLPTPEARAEIVNSVKVIEAATGRRPLHFAFPGAQPGDREARMAADAGLETALTMRRGALKQADAEKPTAWPCIPIDGRYQSLAYLELALAGVLFAFDRTPIAAASR
jgi:peptidoglycan/xylan/chitin deacetylase (PgdA/CDA1 family)